jgi:CheY-like chemotaxis protein
VRPSIGIRLATSVTHLAELAGCSREKSRLLSTPKEKNPAAQAPGIYSLHNTHVFLVFCQSFMDPLSTDGGIRPRVLIADDERLIADTLGMILNQNGFEAATVYGGQKAVETARHFRPDVFLADVVMPGMSGIEAAIQICAMIPGCRVLLLSGQAATSDLMRDARVRGHDFEIILKPVHPNQLLDRLRPPS